MVSREARVAGRERRLPEPLGEGRPVLCSLLPSKTKTVFRLAAAEEQNDLLKIYFS